MDDKEHYDRGMAMRRKTLGAAHVDRAVANTTPFNADFQNLLTRYAWGIWARPHFDVRKEAGEVLAAAQK
jgi:4-carboxymuconolactone decarboxylase